MHFFYSFLRKSVDRYNESNTNESNQFFMINAIGLSKIFLNDTALNEFFKYVAPLYKKSLQLRFLKEYSMKYDMAVNRMINLNQDSVFKALSQLSAYQKESFESQLEQRKMTWDTFAVETTLL